MLQQIRHIALRHVGDVDVASAALVGAEIGVHHDLLEPAHVFGREGQRAVDAHLDARPAIVVVARGDHRHAFDVEFELREIGHRRKREADIVDFCATRQQACHERGLDGGGIRPEVVADDDPQRHAPFAHQRREAKANRFHAKKINLVRVEPARVVFAKARGLDEGKTLEGGGIGDEVLAGLREHSVSSQTMGSRQRHYGPGRT